MKLLVATVWSYPGRPVEDSPLWQSCRRLGVPLFVSQSGEPYLSHFQNKIAHLARDLRAKDWDYVLFADGNDTFLTRRPEEAGALLAAYGTDFLVSAEAECWPNPARHAGLFPPAASACRFPNSGVYVATRAAFEREFAAMAHLSATVADPADAVDDQYLFIERLLSGRSGMRADDRGLLSLSLNAHPEPAAALRRRILLGDAPLVVHGNGPAKGVALEHWRDFTRLADLRAELRYYGPCSPPEYDPATEAAPAGVALDGPPAPTRASNHIDGLIDLIRSLPPLGAVAEVGCHMGVSTEAWALLAGRVYAVDIWRDRAACDIFRRRMGAYANVQAIRGDSRRAAAAFPDRSLDLVYLDADHHYEPVKADILAWLPTVKPGGWIAGHDHIEYWDCGGVIRAVAEVLGGPDRVFSDFSWLVRLP